tara:strand:- start:19910 stop:20728 length:819 start_codon:yes stop_codon:yes gene_type:complete
VLKDIEELNNLPKHLAVVMDGNGRWAQVRGLARNIGHEQGVKALKELVNNCLKFNIRYLTVFAFSSENWNRPEKEVSFLMQLFMRAIRKEIKQLHDNDVRLKIIGERSALSKTLRELISDAEFLTSKNLTLDLNVAINYGGRWDIVEAVKHLIENRPELIKSPNLLTEHELTEYIALSDIPEPDLFIRTGGEQRLSNFLLWKLAYTELFFTDTHWPDFDTNQLLKALNFYIRRVRKFGSLTTFSAQQQLVSEPSCSTQNELLDVLSSLKDDL